jgi:quinol monooxygenase YgiN
VPRLRVLYQVCRDTNDVDDLLAHTEAARSTPGCEESECYRAFEHAENLCVIELWTDEWAYTAHWRELVQSGKAWDTILRSTADRTYGRNGTEFYWQQYYSNKDGVWTPPEDHERSSAVLWAGGGPVRIIGQATRGEIQETMPVLVAYSEETRREPGCLQFEHHGSIEPNAQNDSVNLELWTSQVIYDRHWALRRRSVAAGAVLASGGRSTERPERRFGGNGYEYYQCVYYTHLYDHWRPEDVDRWSESVRWRGWG